MLSDQRDVACVCVVGFQEQLLIKWFFQKNLFLQWSDAREDEEPVGGQPSKVLINDLVPAIAENGVQLLQGFSVSDSCFVV